MRAGVSILARRLGLNFEGVHANALGRGDGCDHRPGDGFAGHHGQMPLEPEMLPACDQAGDQRFATNPKRCNNREALNALIEPIFSPQPRQVWRHKLDQAGVPNVPVQNTLEMIDRKLAGVSVSQPGF